MLAFFRKIRWQLAENNQFFKYSRYAIGEIVLVVIGILIALQVNDWNEGRKGNIEMLKLLGGLEKEFERELSNLQDRAIHYDSMFVRTDRILNTKDYKKIPYPYIQAGIASILWAGTYDTGNGALESIISSGKMELIKNIELNATLAQWDQNLKETQDNETGMRNYVLLVIIPKLASLNFDVTEVHSFHNINFWEIGEEPSNSQLRIILENPEFRSLATYRMQWLRGSKREFNSTTIKCASILRAIRDEIVKYEN